MKYSSFLFLLLFYCACSVTAQVYQLEQINYANLRNQQVLGDSNLHNSFTVLNNQILPLEKTNWKKPTLSLLPIVLAQQVNTHHPFGFNDGAMMQAKGYQVLVRPGVNMRYGIVEIQFAPEALFATNNKFPFNDTLYGNANNKAYSQILPGQSFVKAHIGPISVGLSSENLWWGPGINSALLMSNNAPGFLHAFIGTNKPIKTPIGNIEFNLIGAKLSSNKALGYENYHLRTRSNNNDWRYLNSYVISWQPKWVKGLFLGIARSMQEYGTPAFERPTGIISKYFPVIFSPTQKTNNFGDDTLGRDQLASVFMRWVLPKSHTELYVEFGKNDYGVNLRDYINGPTHSAAYTVGVRKLIKKSKEQYIQLEAELTQMSQSPDHLVRPAGNWYVHSTVSQGYTNNNQILGAGAGFGTNVQTFAATWVHGNLRNGFLIQRFERDPVFRPIKWTDFSIGWMPQWEYKKMLISAKLQLIRSTNYIWEKGNNPLNLHSRLVVQYNFN